MTSVLFVCLGNICRSPLAEGAFRLVAERADIVIEIDSAGTGAWHIGEPPDQRAQAAARRHGVDISGHRARQVERRDFDRFTHLVALDRANLSALEALRPRESTATVRLLLDYVPGRAGEPVADPYYGEARGFDRTWDDVAAGAEGLANLLLAAR